MIALPAVIVVALVLLLTDGGEDSRPGSALARAKVDRFDSGRAWKHLKHQVSLGPRPSGSQASRELAAYIRARIPRGHYENVEGGPRNVVGRIPGSKPAIAVAAHYDTKDMPGFVGANDGAGGTAAVLELARVLRHADRLRGAPALRFVLFDGEEATDDTSAFERTGIRGSKAYARAHADELRALTLLDFVAAKDMRMVRDASSDP